MRIHAQPAIVLQLEQCMTVRESFVVGIGTVCVYTQFAKLAHTL